MDDRKEPKGSPILLMAAGAAGAVASTVAAAVAAAAETPNAVLPALTTAGRLSGIGPPEAMVFSGWDLPGRRLLDALGAHGVLPEALWRDHEKALASMPLLEAPDPGLPRKEQVRRLEADIRTLRQAHPGALPVLVDLLPACETCSVDGDAGFDELLEAPDAAAFPDLSYILAAIRSGVPVVNFTPNAVETRSVCGRAHDAGIPMAGRDGKTGQTFLKGVLASAFRARNLLVDGWYSLNILGNADGENLMDPARAAGKMENKTRLLDEILGYPVGGRYGTTTHKVHIDYYPPRGDAKEAWDVIDFTGLFGLPMSLRLNLQGRDSILAAPMVIDLARWLAAASVAGFAGPVADLAFFFKKPVGEDPPVQFHEQVGRLAELEAACAGSAGKDRS